MLRPWAFITFLFLCSCGIKNHDPQPSVRAYEVSPRVPPAGTVSRENVGVATLKNGYPENFKLSREVLIKGEKLYQVHCVACHGYDGEGDGIVTRKGLYPPPSYMSQKLIEASPLHFYQVMTSGKGRMPGYARRLLENERWAVAAYIKALQLSRNINFERLDNADKEHFR